MEIQKNANRQTSRIRRGETFQTAICFNTDTIRHYATMAGDTNPLHHDSEHAHKSRFGRLIACGAHSTGLMMSTVAHFLSERGGALGLEFSFQFRKTIPEGAVLQLVWTVSDVEEKTKLNGHIITLEGQLRDQAGTIYVSSVGKGLAVLGDNVL